MNKKIFTEKFKLSLFIKLSIVMIISLLASNIFISALAMSIMEDSFIDSFTIANEKTLNQISDKFASFNTTIASVVNTYRQNSFLREYFTQDISDQTRLFKVCYNMKTYLKSIEQTSSYTDLNVIAVGVNGRTFISSGDTLNISIADLEKHPITVQSKVNPSKIFYNYCFPGITTNTKRDHVIIVTKQLIDPYTATNFGTIYITIDESVFSNMYGDIWPNGSKTEILSSNGMVVSSSDKRLVGTMDTIMVKLSAAHIESGGPYTNIKHNKNDGVLIAKYLPVYDMYMVNIIDKNYILKGFIESQPLIYLVCFFISFLAIALVFLITRRITQPLTHLVSHMRGAKNGNFTKVSEVRGSYEVRELQQVYNIMVDEIDNYVNRLVSEQKGRRKAEISALQMQINPHFLYNTLASIKYLSWQGNTQAVTDTINALILLLQNTISKTDEKITVQEELLNLKNYVAINHVRYGSDIEVEYSVDDDCLDCLIPKLIIQPFIENAFFHAYQKKQEGCIRIFIKHRVDKLICEVIDDGDGISIDRCDKLLNKKYEKDHFSGIGIRNVDERLKLIYGEEYGVKIISKVGVGTTVTIEMKYEK
jgi:two-component system sensor histidine kinase YesM